MSEAEYKAYQLYLKSVKAMWNADRAKTHLSEWKKSGQQAGIKKIEKIIEELSETPYAGVGLPEPEFKSIQDVFL